MFQLFMLLAARWYASNYLVLDMSVASVVVRSLNKCPQNWLSTRKISFHDTFMIFIIITINNVMIIITLCPEATSSCNRCFFNVRCPCQPPHRHRHQWDTAPSPSPGHVARAWPGDTCLGHVACAGRGVTGLDWTGFYSVLLCSALIHLLLPRTSVGGTQPPPPPPSWPGQHQTYGGHQPSSLHYQACEYAGPVSTSPATLMSLWPVLASLSLFN